NPELGVGFISPDFLPAVAGVKRVFRPFPLVQQGRIPGEGGIRTLDTLLGYGALAKRCFQPLSHLTKNRLREYREEIWIANISLLPGMSCRDGIVDIQNVAENVDRETPTRWKCCLRLNTLGAVISTLPIRWWAKDRSIWFTFRAGFRMSSWPGRSRLWLDFCDGSLPFRGCSFFTNAGQGFSVQV